MPVNGFPSSRAIKFGHTIRQKVGAAIHHEALSQPLDYRCIF
jgi:hypothetical protein